MSQFEKAFAQVQGLRRKFQDLLDTARAKAPPAQTPPAHRPARLQEVTAFGKNPGNLRMFLHVPERLPKQAPLVVALHGCSQTAVEYDQGTGWSTLADQLGFAVLYPQQQEANNPKNCFSWFLPGDIARDSGEALSIAQMIEHTIGTFGIDRGRIFVTGLSAGGAMAAVMLATYPEVFAGGALIAGLPYGSARSAQQAFEVMFTEQTSSAPALSEKVRTASKHRGPWPKISVWHGTADQIVKPCNADNIIRQWTDLHGLSADHSYRESVGAHSRRVWNDSDGNPVIEAFSIAGMAHGVPLATMAKESCGEAGAFFFEAGISSTHHIARFWHLTESASEMPGRPATMAESVAPLHPEARGLVAVEGLGAEGLGAEGPGAEGPEAIDVEWIDVDESAIDRNAEQKADHALDPNVVIAAAFKAAGLPAPELSRQKSGSALHLSPSSIIDAAFKAAGLQRR